MIPHAIDPAKARRLIEEMRAERAEQNPEAEFRFFAECWRIGFESCLRANFGEVRGTVLNDLIFDHRNSDYRLLLPDQTRAASSKIVCRVRRALGMPVRYPAKGKGRGAKPKKGTVQS